MLLLQNECSNIRKEEETMPGVGMDRDGMGWDRLRVVGREQMNE
jgi:hypothetical protein